MKTENRITHTTTATSANTSTTSTSTSKCGPRPEILVGEPNALTPIRDGSDPRVLAGAMKSNDVEDHPQVGDRDRLHGFKPPPKGQVDGYLRGTPLDTHRGAAPQGQVGTHRGAAPWPDPHNHEMLLHVVDLRTLRDQPRAPPLKKITDEKCR